MKKSLSFFFAGLIALSAVVSYSAFAKASKTAICHITGNGTYQVIVVSDNAINAHLDHGDIFLSWRGLCEELLID